MSSISSEGYLGGLRIPAASWHWAKWVVFTIAVVLLASVDLPVIDRITLGGVLAIFMFGIDSRWSFGGALALLVATPVLQISGQESLSNSTAVYAFYFLCAGAGQALIENRKTEPAIKAVVKEQKPAVTRPTIGSPRRVVRKGIGGDIRRPAAIASRAPVFMTPAVKAPVTDLPVSDSSPKVKKVPLMLVYRLVLFPLIVVGLSGGGLYYFSPAVQPYLEQQFITVSKSDWRNQAKPYVAPKPAVAKAAVPPVGNVPIAVKKALKIKVFNGNGVKGGGSSTAQALNRAGYTVALTDIGDAAHYDYKQTEIHTANRAYAAAVASDLRISRYSILPPLPTQGKYDIIIITGAGS